MAKKKILYITPAIFPYIEENYISSICRYLPQGIQEKENEIRTFMPKYGCINERKNLLHEVIRLSGQNIIIEDTDYPLIIKVASLQSVRMQIYFIDSEDFFRRKALFLDEENRFFDDNDSRIIFFAKGVIETVRKLGWTPDIIHCHSWVSGLVPLFIKTAYKDNPHFQNTRIVTSLYNDHFESLFSDSFANKLKLTGVSEKALKHFDVPNYDTVAKTAIDFSDAVVIGHPEVKDSVLQYLQETSLPVLNHLDTSDYQKYVESYDAFYDTLMEKEPIFFDFE